LISSEPKRLEKIKKYVWKFKVETKQELSVPIPADTLETVKSKMTSAATKYEETLQSPLIMNHRTSKRELKCLILEALATKVEDFKDRLNWNDDEEVTDEAVKIFGKMEKLFLRDSTDAQAKYKKLVDQLPVLITFTDSE